MRFVIFIGIFTFGMIWQAEENGWAITARNAAAEEPLQRSILIVSLDGSETIYGVSMTLGYDEQMLEMEAVSASGNGEGAMVIPGGNGSPLVVGLIHAEGFSAGEAMRLTFIVKNGIPDVSTYSIKEFKITGPKGEPLSGVHPQLHVLNP